MGICVYISCYPKQTQSSITHTGPFPTATVVVSTGRNGGNCIGLYSVSPKLPRTIRVACFGRRRTDFHVFRELSSSFFCCRFLSCQTARLFPRCGFLMWRIGAGARDLQDIDKPMFNIRYISKCKCT